MDPGPLPQMAVHYVLVEVIFRRNVPDYPVILFSAFRGSSGRAAQH